jgi:hypothetical protein
VRGFAGWCFRVYIALNILICSLIPGSRPRETISGLMGRWLVTEQGIKLVIAKALAPWIDRLYFLHDDHCRDIYRQEQAAFQSLYT